MTLVEAQIDRIVGPTHHFGGLGVGNIASQQHQGQTSNPRAAALQGLDKMRTVASLGVPQVILPPQIRPPIDLLHDLGFTGSLTEILPQVANDAPELLSAVMSSSAMWTANAATVTASVDSAHGTPTMTVANLSSSLHRAIEPQQTLCDLQRLFASFATIIAPLPGGAAMRDEGAANHMRLGSDLESPGIHIFVYGDQAPLPHRFWPRQTLAACQAVARQHGLPPENTFFLKQHPETIDAGAFHNDVVAASHHNLFLHHASAYYRADDTLAQIQRRFDDLHADGLRRIEIPESELSRTDAISTYLFNSQIVSSSTDQRPTLLCPMQVAENSCAASIVQRWIDEGLFADAKFLELRQSMSGGGGPACLRLRVPMKTRELSDLKTSCQWSASLDRALRQVIQEDYPESLDRDDLTNWQIAEKCLAAARRIQDLLAPTR
ncbi:N-succinylarginine dihydrolase [Planctomycetes bacterium K23_9]|uniref:N-succinylarginine dihydrolase n=1 Tax=Stieleria marina TaxID=1930275 RepID=A0A517P1V5_9BACT|nr:N-succinylarginine dihydrolase [Planctomycetes bacterium K23_9]